MRIILGIITSFLFFSLTLSAIIFYPVPQVLSQDNITTTFHDLGVHQRVVALISHQIQGMFPDDSAETQLFEKIIQDYLPNIITPEWIQISFNQFVEKAYNTIDNQQNFQDYEVDISVVKSRFLDKIQNSDISENIPELKSQIPDKLFLSQLIDVQIIQIQEALDIFSDFYQTTLIVPKVLIILSLLTALVYFFIFPKRTAISWISANLIISILPIFIFQIIFYNFIFNPEHMRDQINNFSSVWRGLVYLIGLSFIEQINTYWITTAFILLVIGLLLFSSIFIHSFTTSKDVKNK